MSEDLKKKIKEVEKQRDEYLAGWQRAKADFINYKKEEEKRVESLAVFLNGGVAMKLLPILDNFDSAEKGLSEELKNDESIKGFLQIKKQILDHLKELKIEPINAVGEKFDPHFHEAVEEIEEDGNTGTILEEVQKGYKIDGVVLRPAKVKVIKNN